MKLYAQHGYGCGNKINRGFVDRSIKGVILSPRDKSPDRMSSLIAAMKKEFGAVDVFIDPQLYTTVFAETPTAKLGNLLDYPYFPGKRERTDYENTRNIDNDIEVCLKYQSDLPLTGWISPNIVVPENLDSIWGGIAKNFVRETVRVCNRLGEHPPVYSTFALSVQALSQKDEIDIFLDEVTLWEERPAGFYLLVAFRTSESRPEELTQGVIANLLYLIYVLSRNGYEVVVGYSDYLSPFLWISGASAGATGWFDNLRRFSLQRFNPTAEGGRQPEPRYSSAPLLNRIRIQEFTAAQKLGVTQIRSGTKYDNSLLAGGVPSREDEILQHWAAITSLTSIVDSANMSLSLDRAINHVETAQSIYTDMSAVGIDLHPKSDDSHLSPLKQGLKHFRALCGV